MGICVLVETLDAYVLDAVVCAPVSGVEEKETFGWAEVLKDIWVVEKVEVDKQEGEGVMVKEKVEVGK